MKTNWQTTIAAYKTAAERFVHLVDSSAQRSASEFLADIGVSLPELYGAALRIPSVKPETSDVDEFSWPTEVRAVLYNDLREKLGQLDGYWTIFDATSNEVSVQGSLADDICDIYFDVKSDLQYLEREGPSDDVLWDICFGLLTHWGRHLTSALKAIHDLGVM